MIPSFSPKLASPEVSSFQVACSPRQPEPLLVQPAALQVAVVPDSLELELNSLQLRQEYLIGLPQDFPPQPDLQLVQSMLVALRPESD